MTKYHKKIGSFNTKEKKKNSAPHTCFLVCLVVWIRYSKILFQLHTYWFGMRKPFLRISIELWKTGLRYSFKMSTPTNFQKKKKWMNLLTLVYCQLVFYLEQRSYCIVVTFSWLFFDSGYSLRLMFLFKYKEIGEFFFFYSRNDSFGLFTGKATQITKSTILSNIFRIWI